jgi:hypothetical protein
MAATVSDSLAGLTGVGFGGQTSSTTSRRSMRGWMSWTLKVSPADLAAG